jgi:hypothetical protein
MLRQSFFGIGLVYAVFLLLFLTGKGAAGESSDALGILIFGLFGLSLIFHMTLIFAARSWGIGFLALLSTCLLFVLLIWVLHRVTGDSL